MPTNGSQWELGTVGVSVPQESVGPAGVGTVGRVDPPEDRGVDRMDGGLRWLVCAFWANPALLVVRGERYRVGMGADRNLRASTVPTSTE